MAAGGITVEELQEQIAEIRQTSWEAQERASRLQNEVDILRQQLARVQIQRGGRAGNPQQPSRGEVAALKETVQVATNQRLQRQLTELRPRAGALQFDHSDAAFGSSSMHMMDDSSFFRDPNSHSASPVVNHLNTPIHPFNQSTHLGEIGSQHMQSGLPPLNPFVRYVPISMPPATNHFDDGSDGGQNHGPRKKHKSKEPEERSQPMALESGTRGGAKGRRTTHAYIESDGDGDGMGDTETGGDMGTTMDEIGEGWVEATAGAAEGWTSGPTGFRCNRCNRFFKHNRDMERHYRVHTGERPYRCPVRGCGKKFAQSGTLGQHMVVHTGERPFVCPHEGCGLRFTQSGAMKNHARLHTGEKPFTCNVEGCGAAFSRRDNLSRHARTHTGEKPYECSECDARFTLPTTLAIHIRTHTHERPYKCPAENCDLWFSQHAHAKRHAVRKHGFGESMQGIAAGKRTEEGRGMRGGNKTKKEKENGRKVEEGGGEVRGGEGGVEVRGGQGGGLREMVEPKEGEDGVIEVVLGIESLGHVS